MMTTVCDDGCYDDEMMMMQDDKSHILQNKKYLNRKT